MSGWVKIYRQSLDNPIVCKDSDHFAVWCYLLLKATHSEIPMIHEGSKITLKKGQLITGRKVIAAQFNISESKVQRILKSLEIEQQIEQQTTPRNRLISILNWEKYQEVEQQSEQQVNNKRTTSEQQVNTNKNVKNVKNEKNVKKVKIFMTPTIQEVDDYCQERNNTVDPERFVDFYSSKGWMVGKNKMTDWKSCVRTWEKNNQGTNKGNNVKTFAEMAKEEMQREELYNE